MSEPKRDPFRRVNVPGSPAAPTDGPDALSIIERAAREMATRRPRNIAPEPDHIFTEPVSREPINKTAEEIAKEFADEIAKQSIEPIEALTIPIEAKWTDDIQPLVVTDLAQNLEPEPLPVEDTSAMHPADIFQPAEEASPTVQSEPPVETKPIELSAPIEQPEPAIFTQPPAEIPQTPPKTAPLIAPPARPSAASMLAPKTARPMYDDHFHISLTTVQSAALAVAIFAFVVAAFGMAARGWVVAHDWSCRVGMTANSCPPSPPPKSLGRAEIPS